MSALSALQQDSDTHIANPSSLLLSFISNKYSHLYSTLALDNSNSGKSVIYSIVAILGTYILIDLLTRTEKNHKKALQPYSK